MYRKNIIIILTILIVGVIYEFPLQAAEKNWAGSGDGSAWADDDNWFPSTEPTIADEVSIDIEAAAVTCEETFKAKSIIVGGREKSSLTTNNFVFGTIAPDETSDAAMMARSGGTITLSGAGTVTLQGQYKDSEESLDPEPSFMFWLK